MFCSTSTSTPQEDPEINTNEISSDVNNMNISVLVDAKQEYSKQLIQLLLPHLLSGLLSIYDEAHVMCTENNDEDLSMLTFQELLSQVPKWNQILIKEETDRIERCSGCDWIEDLITAVFVCHTKILTTVRISNRNSNKINLQIPSVTDFIHQIYINLAREFWKHPYLISPHDTTKLQYQQNLSIAEEKIHHSIEATIRALLPIKNILKEYLKTDETEIELKHNNVTSPVTSPIPLPVTSSVPSPTPLPVTSPVPSPTFGVSSSEKVNSLNSSVNGFTPLSSPSKSNIFQRPPPLNIPSRVPPTASSTNLLTPPKEFDDMLASLKTVTSPKSTVDLTNTIVGEKTSLSPTMLTSPLNSPSSNRLTSPLNSPSSNTSSSPNTSSLSNCSRTASSSSTPFSTTTSAPTVSGSLKDLSSSILKKEDSSSDLSNSILGTDLKLDEVVVDFGKPYSSF